MRIRSTQTRLSGASRRLAVSLVLLLTGAAAAQTPKRNRTLKMEKKYPAMTEFMMPRDAEIALARSAGPEPASARATIKILTTSEFKVAIEGDNGFACLVLRGWGAPTYNPEPFRDFIYVRDSARTDLLRPGFCPNDDAVLRAAAQAWAGRQTADEIAKGVEAAYAKGELPKVEPSIGYMLSRDMYLGPHLGHDFVYPHIILYCPTTPTPRWAETSGAANTLFLSDNSRNTVCGNCHSNRQSARHQRESQLG